MGNKNTEFGVYFLGLFCFLTYITMVYNIRCGIFLKVNNVKNKVKLVSFIMLNEYYNRSDNSLFYTDA